MKREREVVCHFKLFSVTLYSISCDRTVEIYILLKGICNVRHVDVGIDKLTRPAVFPFASPI